MNTIALKSDYIILGGGSVTAEYYVPALTALGAGICIVDPNASSLASFRQFPNVVCVQQDHTGFLNGLGSGEERVVVALPNHLHVEAVRAALDKGRNVLCEKPLSLNAADCRDLAVHAGRSSRILNVAMSRRFLPSLMLARQMVAAQELGPVRAVEVRDCAPFAWRPKSFAFFAPQSGGVLADMGVHYLDYLDTVLGPLEPISYSDDARGGCEASVSYDLRANGVPIHIGLSRLDGNATHILFACERGVIRIDKQDELSITVTPHAGSPRRVAMQNPFPVAEWPKNFHGSFCAMLHSFEEALHGGQSGLADAVDAERTAGLIEWAYRTRSVQGRSSNARGRAARPEILVTGATGFIGGHLVDRLSEEGRAVRALVRSPAACANIARHGLDIVPADLLKRTDVEAAARGVRTIFHLAYGRDGSDGAAVTIEGTKNIVEAAVAAGVESVVVLSTMYVFGFPDGAAPVDETFPYKPYGGVYGDSKAAMERWCLDRAKTSGKTRIVILNPTCVFGPGGAAYTKLPVQLARQGQFCWIDDGAGICNYTYVGNVADAMIAAAANPDAHGQRFIINDGALSWRDFLQPLLAPLDTPIPNYSVEQFKAISRSLPPFRVKDLVSAVLSSREFRDVAKRSRLVRKALTSMGDDRRSRLFHTPAPGQQMLPSEKAADATVPPEWLLELYPPVSARFSAEKARRILGWQPRTPYETARDETMRWLADAGYYAKAAYGTAA